MKTLPLDQSVGPVLYFRGGWSEAQRRLGRFLSDHLAGYREQRNEPAARASSTLSPYLHFGQIAPVEIALAARSATNGADDDRSAFLEELIVRRELAINFVHYEADYDSYRSLPDWAQNTLADHRNDKRSPCYSHHQLEAAETHDPYWNAAMQEMRLTGYMQSYMRMYWGKKILEWSETPEDAYRTMLALNNRYFLDGRDANSFANVAWCFGLHDRPWPERPIFGKVRYMNATGLHRKFDMVAYLALIDELAGKEAKA